jgi:hypothetical protein
MNKHRILYWSPRILSILFALFISLFALDVFQDGRGFWQTTRALLFHLIPTTVIVLVLVLSWHKEWIGGVLYVALALFYIVWMWGKFPWVVYLGISGPLALLGLLFFLAWRYKAALHEQAE